MVVLDNIDQPGPRYATKLYLDANPDWKEVGHAVEIIDAGNPLGDLDGSFPETKFFLLKAPHHFTVSNVPRSFGSILTDSGKLTAIEIDIVGPARGVLHYRVYCRAFGAGMPEELTTTESVPVDVLTGGPWKIPLQNPLMCTKTGPEMPYGTEIILAFVPARGTDRLRLRTRPSALPRLPPRQTRGRR